jgi:TetR/AcrR family transcriptional regulator
MQQVGSGAVLMPNLAAKNATPLAANDGEKVTSRHHQKQATRQAVLDAATQLFAARGFDGTTMPAITAECGVPVPLMVYHFKTKELLWQECVNEVYQKLDAHISQYQAEIDAAQGYDFFRIKIRAQIKALAAQPEYMRILFQEGTQKSKRLEWLVENHQRRMTARTTELIERAQAEGYLPQMDLIHAKFIISGALSFPIVLAAEYRLIDGVDPEGDAFIDRHVDLCLQLFMPEKRWQ